MAKFNQRGQWTLEKDETELMFKTGEQKSAGKNKLVERKLVKTDSDEASAFFRNMARNIMSGTPKQPTDEEMFGHLVPTEEQVATAKKKWESTISGFYSHKSLENIDSLNKSDDKLNFEMENGKSFNDYLRERLSAEELKKRNLSS